MFFNLPAKLRKQQNLCIAQRRLILLCGRNRYFLRAAGFGGHNCQLLGRNLLVDNGAVPHFIDIRIHQAGNQRFTQSKAGVNR